MTIPLQAGENKVSVTFVRTWDRTWGAVISLVTLVLVALLLVRDRRVRLARVGQ